MSSGALSQELASPSCPYLGQLISDPSGLSFSSWLACSCSHGNLWSVNRMNENPPEAFSVKVHTVYILGFGGHITQELQLFNCYFWGKKQSIHSQFVSRWVWLCYNKSLLIKIESRPGLASSSSADSWPI